MQNHWFKNRGGILSMGVKTVSPTETRNKMITSYTFSYGFQLQNKINHIKLVIVGYKIIYIISAKDQLSTHWQQRCFVFYRPLSNLKKGTIHWSNLERVIKFNKHFQFQILRFQPFLRSRIGFKVKVSY